MKRWIRGVTCCLLLCVLVCGTLNIGASAATQTDARQSADYSTLELIPGGVPFGVKFTTDGVLVVGFCDIQTDAGPQNPAREAGLRMRDVLTHIEGQEIGSAEELTTKITSSGGAPLRVTYTRGGKAAETTMIPKKDATGEYKTG